MSAVAAALVLAVPVTSALAREGGAYDPHHHWHNADWWHTHHPEWMYEL